MGFVCAGGIDWLPGDGIVENQVLVTEFQDLGKGKNIMELEELESRWEEILARLLEVYEGRPMDCDLEIENGEEVE